MGGTSPAGDKARNARLSTARRVAALWLARVASSQEKRLQAQQTLQVWERSKDTVLAAISVCTKVFPGFILFFSQRSLGGTSAQLHLFLN